MPIIYFISDVHLGIGGTEADKRRQERLLAFFKEVEKSGSHLYILGDLFDFWYEYGSVVPRGYHAVLAGLERLRRAGVGIDYLRGNHDFGAGEFFSRDMGIPVRDEMEVQWEGKRFYLYHGDGLAQKDGGYRLLKKMMRHRVSLWGFRWLHPDIGFRLARFSSEKSRDYTAMKDYGMSDGQVLRARAKIREGFDFVVMGHRHIPVKLPVETGVYVNLGDWIRHYSYAVFDGTDMELKLFNGPED